MERMKAVHPSIRVASTKNNKQTNERTKKRLEKAYALSLFFYCIYVTDDDDDSLFFLLSIQTGDLKIHIERRFLLYYYYYFPFSFFVFDSAVSLSALLTVVCLVNGSGISISRTTTTQRIISAERIGSMRGGWMDGSGE